MAETQKFLLFRKKANEEPRYERYEVPLRKGMTILEALFYIQDHFDSTLAFRYSCRGAICGSCSVTVDKVPQLACKTQVSKVKAAKKPPKLPELNFGDISDWNKEEEILIEPLPNMEVVKDLVVDMEPFWAFYREVEPYLEREWNDESPESTQSSEDAKSIENLVYCILCGLCWSCPVNASNKDYLGPSSLAKGYRFIADSRISDEHREGILEKVWKKDGVPACEKFFVCNRVCPKGVKPGTAIKKIREEWLRDE
ncbi:MAG: succinate dehydrogenase/fumarate reductase iron-sulfur subunit [Candidatus Heimdallarchaeota archaeon]|nr:succinate dehydrogenase/fumarate reductase iron-sulfur subunit [Candidatus Heimdallarchaeota archaeon]